MVQGKGKSSSSTAQTAHTLIRKPAPSLLPRPLRLLRSLFFGMDDLLKSINIQECLSMSQSFNHVRPIWGSLVVGKNFQHKALLLLRVFSGLIWDLFVSVFQPLEEKASNDPKVVSPAEQAALRTKLRTARGGKRGCPKKTATEGDEDDASDMDEKKPKKHARFPGNRNLLMMCQSVARPSQSPRP